jgi:hypothetical protein
VANISTAASTRIFAAPVALPAEAMLRKAFIRAGTFHTAGMLCKMPLKLVENVLRPVDENFSLIYNINLSLSKQENFYDCFNEK